MWLKWMPALGFMLDELPDDAFPLLETEMDADEPPKEDEPGTSPLELDDDEMGLTGHANRGTHKHVTPKGLFTSSRILPVWKLVQVDAGPELDARTFHDRVLDRAVPQ